MVGAVVVAVEEDAKSTSKKEPEAKQSFPLPILNPLPLQKASLSGNVLRTKHMCNHFLLDPRKPFLLLLLPRLVFLHLQFVYAE